MVAQELDHGLQRILGSRGNTQFVGLNRHLDLELLILDVLIDLLGSRLVDTLDDVTEHAHGTARCSLGRIPGHGLKIDAALDELGAQDVDDLLGDKVGRGVDRKELVALRKLDGGAGVLEVIALEISRVVCWKALSTSCILTSDTTSKLESLAMVNPFAYERLSSCRTNNRWNRSSFDRRWRYRCRPWTGRRFHPHC